ncbi:hypothetical protein I6A60_26780 [Frankia sp. AgB1.9]|uniref:hypothetical protein n=1 Tax=unclassified Frankia TaxID=2632575 RepID=UPI0019322F0F|nr:MULTISPECIES: hypothetical protein [unclassified Frankia]MBL7488588.1 hypothetical protein [Frankia sp. AgW1.1]MBL7551434.1 hypothetical protein [Frankia sp. AgB1.9]MBL7619785.1 hypothetical protein [Frankia sp. AgB1.8]
MTATEDLEGVAARLRASRDALPPVAVGERFAVDVRAGARRRRRRGVAAAASALVVVVAVAAPVGLRVEDSGTVVGPAATIAETSPPRADAGWGGIRIGWLPAGTTHLGDAGGPNGQGIGNETDQPGTGVAYTGHQDAIYVSSFTQASEKDSLLRIVVSWAPQEDFVASSLLEGGTPITVHGQPGRLYDGGLASRAGAPPDYRAGLTWREASDGPVVAVTAQGAAPVDTGALLRVAENITVVGEPGAVQSTTREQIQAAFTTALGHPPAPDDAWVRAVENGPKLLKARQQLLASFPHLSANVTATVTHAVWTGPDTIRVDLTYAYNDPTTPIAKDLARQGTNRSGHVEEGEIGLEAVRVDGHWLVTARSYCTILVSLVTDAPGCG